MTADFDPKRARVSSYGHGVDDVKHWQLYAEGEFIADTSAPHIAERFERIAEACRRAEDADAAGRGSPVP